MVMLTIIMCCLVIYIYFWSHLRKRKKIIKKITKRIKKIVKSGQKLSKKLKKWSITMLLIDS